MAKRIIITMVPGAIKHTSATSSSTRSQWASRSRRRDPVALVALAQGGYFSVTGIWPLMSMRSFEWVTGPKTDHWLVKTVGALIAVIGGVLGLAGLRGRRTPEVALLGTGSALSLAAVDTVYALRGRIASIYLLDAIAERGIAGAWAVAWTLGRHETTRTHVSHR